MGAWDVMDVTPTLGTGLRNRGPRSVRPAVLSTTAGTQGYFFQSVAATTSLSRRPRTRHCSGKPPRPPVCRRICLRWILRKPRSRLTPLLKRSILEVEIKWTFVHSPGPMVEDYDRRCPASTKTVSGGRGSPRRAAGMRNEIPGVSPACRDSRRAETADLNH